MINRFTYVLLWAAVFALLATRPASGQTISWGNSASLFDPGSGTFPDKDFDSDGNAITDATFTFSFGVFEIFDAGAGENVEYDPYSASDPAEWVLYWTELATTTYNDTTNFFGGDYQVQATNEYQGYQAYIWVSDAAITPATTVDETTEWFLITDNSGDADDWIIPAHGDQTAGNPDWRVSGATTSLYGGVNGTDGPGNQTANPPGFEMQTNTYIAPVPEPGAFVMLGFAAALGLLRRRR